MQSGYRTASGQMRPTGFEPVTFGFVDRETRASQSRFPLRCDRNATQTAGLKASSVCGITASLSKMTTRERIETLLDRLSENQLAAEYLRLRETVEADRVASGHASCGVLRHMTEDEERAGLSWAEFRPQRPLG